MTELLVDTSVAVPLVMAAHAAHGQVTRLIDRRSVALCGHALLETYAVLTRLPGDARLAPDDALRLLEDRFEPAAILDARRTRSAPSTLARAGIAGGATYDGVIALAARAAGVPLASRDRRAANTYRMFGVEVEYLG